MPTRSPHSLKSRGRAPAETSGLTQYEVLVGLWIHLYGGLECTKTKPISAPARPRYASFMTTEVRRHAQMWSRAGWVSVRRIIHLDLEAGDAARSGLSCRSIWSVGVAGAPPVWFRSDGRPGLPGEKLTTYRTKGLLQERKNLEPSAGSETPGKPPSPAMSRPRGGAFVVVRARESRAHGEGRQ